METNIAKTERLIREINPTHAHSRRHLCYKIHAINVSASNN